MKLASRSSTSFRVWLIVAAVLLGGEHVSANDTPSEGLFLNSGRQPLYCFGDRMDPVSNRREICRTKILQGQSCRGDAISSGETGTVYRIPTYSSVSCEGRGFDIRCESSGLSSDVLFLAAGVAKGGGYGILTWDEFYSSVSPSRFGPSPVVDCPGFHVSDSPAGGQCHPVQGATHPLPPVIPRYYR